MKHAFFSGAALLAAALLAACDGGGGTGGSRLSPAEVAGVYQVCDLAFTPSNAILPAAELLRTVVDTTPSAGRPEPTLALALNGGYDLVYTRQSDNFLQQLRGSVSYGQDVIGLELSSGAIPAELLLPRVLSLRFSSTGGQRLTAGAGDNFPYAVSRADYARAAGVSEEGLQNTINGSLRISLSTGGCGA
ncbi:hypothetical protein [Longimicrobium terrae]|uniref:Uncharacterized protein n=1 Tax=Longimicrobium terrae TaxID=1639882 RepID=A0A841GXR9_9BACT|nr:hypothetical protein [Longimicrobium terrae]MBB4636149.1 hypothetical protein [Longimicrobium terrae]MBB6070544.1 hypothetical protein [Longimicrobium terrae]NNC29530.1 hypothetical protein [Longimicrobium terrae]